jgi:SARP family transcriptional regulator, regulator of embCAB operon
VKLTLTGAPVLEANGARLEVREFGGRKLRLLLAVLVLERQRPMHRDELADVLWPVNLPATWAPALRGLVSKVRALLAAAGTPTVGEVTQAFGSYQVELLPPVDVDVESAAAAVERAERAMGAGEYRDACTASLAAAAIVRRPFLAGEEGHWVERQRLLLQSLQTRALHALGESRLERGQFERALTAANEAIRVAPFNDAGHRQLMRAHAAAGNWAEALRDYERYRVLLAEELGVDPSPHTQALYLELLRDLHSFPSRRARHPQPAPA